MRLPFRRQRPNEADAQYQQRQAAHEAAHEARERELDEWDALMVEAHDLTYQADLLGLRLLNDVEVLPEVQQFLADHPASANPYANMATLEGVCMLRGLDPGTGLPLVSGSL